MAAVKREVLRDVPALRAASGRFVKLPYRLGAHFRVPLGCVRQAAALEVGGGGKRLLELWRRAIRQPTNLAARTTLQSGLPHALQIAARKPRVCLLFVVLSPCYSRADFEP